MALSLFSEKKDQENFSPIYTVEIWSDSYR